MLTRCCSQVASLEQYAMRAFAEALEAIPLALAENSGLPSIASGMRAWLFLLWEKGRRSEAGKGRRT